MKRLTPFSSLGADARQQMRESFLFRDLEGSRFQILKTRIDRYAVRHTLVYFLFTFLWAFAISYRPGGPSPTELIENLFPSTVLCTLIIGFMVYPTRLLLIPVIGFAIQFWILAWLPWVAPYVPQTTHDIDSLYGLTFGLNLLAALPLVMFARLLHNRFNGKIPAYTLDLAISILLGLGITALLMIIVQVTFPRLSEVLPAPVMEEFVTPETLTSTLLRCGYAGVVVLGFMIGTLQFPNPRHVLRALPFALLFPLLGVFVQLGLTLDPLLDVVVLCTLLTLTLPVRLIVPALSTGMPIYIAMTGVIVSTPTASTPAEWVLTIYGLIALAMVILILGLRSLSQHMQDQQNKSIRRLNTVRNYAGVGIFAVDVDSRLVTIDSVTQRMLGAPAKFDLSSMMRRFDLAEQQELRRLMFERPGETTSMLVRLRDVPGISLPRVIRLFLWFEKSVDGSPIVYGLVVDVTGEHLQERALKETLAELSMRQDQQKQMFSIISHELRTPASVISMLVDDLDEPEVDMSRVRNRLREATDQLLGVLSDMRQAVNPEKNLPVNLVPLVPGDLAESIRNTFEMQARASGIMLRLRLGDGANEACMGDAVRIKQILGNLIRNAIIHSRCTTITISYRSVPSLRGEERLGVWSITDDGVGIRPEEVERLFQPFQRGGADVRNRADGSGLGLYIVKTAAQLLGGSVDYFAAPEGGAGYHIRLPEPLALNERLTAADDTPSVEVDFGKLHVLLAEDNALVAEVTSARLRKFMGRVTVVGSGVKALDMIDRTPPDVVITDLFMPEMSGDELTRILRNKGFARPIIGLTAAVVGDDMRQFEQAGASCVMTKPLDDAALMRFLRDNAAALTASATNNGKITQEDVTPDDAASGLDLLDPRDLGH